MITDAGPTLPEQVQALKATVRALAEERDVARQEAAAQLLAAEDLRGELHRTRRECRALAVAKEALEQQIDRLQNPPARTADHTSRWPFKRAGNAL